MNLEWIQSSNGEIPENAFNTGAHDEDGNPLFVARGKHAEGIHPGKLCVGKKGAHIPFGDKEHLKLNYEVLASMTGLYWKSIRDGDSPKDAVSTGQNKNKTDMYSVKVAIDGKQMIGKYNFKNKKALFPHGGKKYQLNLADEVEILCLKVCLIYKPIL